MVRRLFNSLTQAVAFSQIFAPRENIFVNENENN